VRGLADYRPLRLLSRGGQGDVYLAFDEPLQRKVAVKLYRLAEDHATRRRAVAEARYLARVDGTRVQRIYDVVVSGRDLALVMRYVSGCDLATLLARGRPLPPPMALGIAIDVTAALAAAQRFQLVHGDIKGANVLLDVSARATLIDFGIAAISGRHPRGRSLEAVTPEHLGDGALSAQSDFFALGLLLYRMLFARHPFAKDGVVDTAALCRGLADIPVLEGLEPDLSERLEAILRTLLAADPAGRPANARVLRSTLRELRGAMTSRPAVWPSIAELARDERPVPDVPAFPRRLVRLPRRQRWAAAILALWRRLTGTAQLAVFAASVLLLSVPVLVLSMSGPCIELRPLRLDVTPQAAPYLPVAAALEERAVQRLREHYRRAMFVGPLPGSDSLRVLLRQGLRDSCVPARFMQIDLSCDGRDCRLELSSSQPPHYFRSGLSLPVDAGLLAMQKSIDQLVDRHLDSVDF